MILLAKELSVIRGERVDHVGQLVFIACASEIIAVLPERLKSVVAHPFAEPRLDELLFAIMQADAAAFVDQIDDELEVAGFVGLCRHTSMLCRHRAETRPRLGAGCK